MSRVAVVTVNFNAGPMLADTMERVVAASGQQAWEIVVVDNASTDGSLEHLKDQPAVRVVRNARNVGFGAACNQGAAASSAPWILFLNPDCRLAPGVVEALVVEADRWPDCVAVGPRIEDPDGSTQGSARGDPTMLAGVAGRTGWITHRLPSSQVVARQVIWPHELEPGSSSMTVDWLSGACLLVRRVAFEAVGGFDESFFLYWEDADLCRRLRTRGGHVRYVPGVTVQHVVGQSSRHAPEAALRAFHASAYHYYTRWNAPSWWDPRRLLARGALWLRLQARLRAARRSGRR